MKIEGGCHCGYITYEATIDSEQIGICHCTDCQTLSGSAFRTGAIALKDNFRLLTGQPKIYVKTAQSGAKRAQACMASWSYQDWGWFTPGNSIHAVEAKFHAHRNRDTLPIAFVALEG